MDTLKILLDLFFTFAKIGSVTFGGGLAMLPILERELADKRHWTTSEELLDYYAIGQSTPGIIAVNVSTFIGYKRKGVIGGIVATLGIVTPSIIIITLIAKFITTFSEIVWVKKALTGINIAVAALLTYAVWGFAKKSLKEAEGWVLFIAAFSVIYFFNVNSVLVIAVAALSGIGIAAAHGDLKRAAAVGGEKKNSSDTAASGSAAKTSTDAPAEASAKNEKTDGTPADGGRK